MGFIRGDKTISPFETYCFGALRTIVLQVLHVPILLLGTCKRNFINTRTGWPKKIAADVLGNFVSILAVAIVLVLKLASIAEYLLTLIYCVLGTALYAFIGRDDAISTLLWSVEALFSRLEVQKLIVVLQVEMEPCICKPGSQLVTIGAYKEINWICDGCAENYRRIRDLGGSQNDIRFSNLRGCVFSEFAPLEASNVISSDGSLQHWFQKQHLIHEVYDVEMFKWRRTYVQLVSKDKGELKYRYSNDRTETITYPIDPRTEDAVIAKSFAIASKDWNKMAHANYNNKNRGFIKLAGSGLLLGIQGALGLLQIRQETNALKAMAIIVSTQLAWFQVMSEVLLADVPSDTITHADFDRASVKRAKAINYLQRGDKQNLFSNVDNSWYTKSSLVGAHAAKPVTALELLLNANRLVTKTMMFDYSSSGMTAYKHNVTSAGTLYAIANNRSYAPVWEVVNLEQLPVGCTVG